VRAVRGPAERVDFRQRLLAVHDAIQGERPA